MTNLKNIQATVKKIIDLSSKSPILADPDSKLFCQQYFNLEKNDSQNTKNDLIKLLCKEHGLKKDRLYTTISSLINLSKTNEDFNLNFKQINFDKMNMNLKPEYYGLFQNLARVKDGVQTMVKIRQDLLTMLEEKKKHEINFEYEDELKIMNSVLKNLLALWFSTGLLNIQRIDWKSPTTLVEKVAHYESVHQIRTLSDLKNRLSASRRCFIYTHSTMPYEPLVILHIALTNSVSSNIGDLIRKYRQEPVEDFDAHNCTNAIFYSINSCQKGLQQVELGNSLIKSCVRLLLEELPNLKNFHTLSPIPKFKEWLDLKISHKLANKNDFFDLKKCFNSNELEFLYLHLKTNNFNLLLENIKSYINSNSFRKEVENYDTNLNEFVKTNENQLNMILANFLRRSCAFYLYYEKKNGYAFNSVTNFHIKNGAQIYRINFGGDQSDNGWKSSYSLMVNYGYNINDFDYNCVNYLTNKTIIVSDSVDKLLINFK